MRRDFPAELSQFIASHIENAGHLEVLFLLHRPPPRSWEPSEITRELRSNQNSVDRWLALLAERGLAVVESAGYRFQAASPDLQRCVDELAKIYQIRPSFVIEEIHSQPNRQLMDFVRAFELRKKA